jgi:hypothetical protein
MTEQEENKPAPVSTKQVRYDDKRSTRYRQYLGLVKTFSDDVGEPNTGQRSILGLLELPLRSAGEQRDKFNLKESTLTKDGRIDEAILKDYIKVCDMAIRLIKEFYHLSGKSATKKRLRPIREIIEGGK